jgi:hypothetical protein
MNNSKLLHHFQHLDWQTHILTNFLLLIWVHRQMSLNFYHQSNHDDIDFFRVFWLNYFNRKTSGWKFCPAQVR